VDVLCPKRWKLFGNGGAKGGGGVLISIEANRQIVSGGNEASMKTMKARLVDGPGVRKLRCAISVPAFLQFTVSTVPVVLLLGFVVSCAKFSEPTESPAAQPRIVLDRATWDLGVCSEDKEYRHEFRARNEGDGPLRVFDIKVSCNCAAAVEVSKRIIGPQEKLAINVALQPNAWKGKGRLTAYVFTNDPASPVTQLELSAEFPPAFIVKPKVARFDDVVQDSGIVERTVLLKVPNETRPLEPESIELSANWLTAGLSRVEQDRCLDMSRLDGGCYELRIRLDTHSALPTEIRESIRIKTATKWDELVVPVKGFVRSDLSVSPSALFCMFSENDSPKMRYVTVSRREGGLVIERCDFSDSHLAVAVLDGSSPDQKVLEVTFLPPRVGGHFREYLVLITNSPVHKRLAVECSGGTLRGIREIQHSGRSS